MGSQTFSGDLGNKVHGLMLLALFVMAPVNDAQETVWRS